MKNPNDLEGDVIIFPEIISRNFSARVARAFNTVHQDAKREIMLLSKQGSLSSDISKVIERLLVKHSMSFDFEIKELATNMLLDVNKTSKFSVGRSLKSINEDFTVSNELFTVELKDTIESLTQQNVSLFKSISPKYFAGIEAHVINSISTKGGSVELEKALNKLGKHHKNYAKNTALDQTRKAYTSVNLHRMKGAGIKEVVWVHSGSSNAPRKLHKQMNGNTYFVDNPPFIGKMYGQDVYGFGGVLPHCRCTIKPMIRLND